MELYNKEFVYFDWDEKLDGKKVMVSDDIYKLKRYVNSEEINTYEVSKSSDDKYPFRVSGTAFRFCYYDPYYELRKAYLKGKQIQFKGNIDNWVDIAGIPLFNASPDEYRIKPESEYVPFDTVQELIDAWDEKYPQNKNRPEGTMPLIWVKSKQKNRVYLITDFLFDKYFNNDVGTEDSNLQLKELFEDYTFADGSIIGKVKE